jgi:hypothetical protein
LNQFAKIAKPSRSVSVCDPASQQISVIATPHGSTFGAQLQRRVSGDGRGSGPLISVSPIARVG